jgi:hypothetical protein
MISKDTLQPEWINKVSAENLKADRILIEKVIRALLLLEGLAQTGLPFIFKGGSSVMLLQQNARRFSIDVDIVVQDKADFDTLFTKFIEGKYFTRFEVQKRKTDSEINKLHYKFFYNPAYQKNISEDNILLDILIEKSPYKIIIPTDINLPFVQQAGAPLQVNIPGKEDILGDKLTAFAPNTTGIPYEKGGVSMAMEIIKQLYDIGNLFEDISDIKTVAETFIKIAQTEMKYRKLQGDVIIVLDDILTTTLCLVTRGKSGNGDFAVLQKGISQLRSYIFSEGYYIEKAIVHAARAAYLAKLIETGAGKLIRFENAQQIVDWQIEAPQDTRLNKLKKSNPEAFFYWYQVYLLGQKAGKE